MTRFFAASVTLQVWAAAACLTAQCWAQASSVDPTDGAAPANASKSTHTPPPPQQVRTPASQADTARTALHSEVIQKTPVFIRFVNCSPLIAQQVRSFVAIDGRYSPEEDLSLQKPAALSAGIDCQPGHARLLVDNDATKRRLNSFVRRDVLSVTDYTRLMAISLVELVEASGYQGAMADKPRYQLRGRVRVLPPATKWQVSLGAGFGKLDETWSPQLRASAEARWRSWFQLGLAALVQRGERQLEPGDATLTSASAALYSTLRTPLGGTAASIGAGIRVGYVSIDTASSDPQATARDVGGVWAAPVAIGTLQRSWGQLSVRLWLEGGWVTLPVTGLIEQQEAVSVDQALFAAGLSVGYQL